MTVMTYVAQVKPGQQKRAVNYLKGLRRAYNSIVDAAQMPFKGYVRLDVAFEDGQIKNLSMDLPRDVRAAIEGQAGIIRICGNGNEAVPIEEVNHVQ